MTAKNKFKSDAYESIHASALALQKIGAIDKATLRSFDASCIAQTPAIGPEQIKQIRIQNQLSQPVFAMYLNTTESTVQKWESGANRPSGMALKLLNIVQKHGIKVLA